MSDSRLGTSWFRIMCSAIERVYLGVLVDDNFELNGLISFTFSRASSF